MKQIFIGLLCVWLLILFPAQSSAALSVPYKTETVSSEGDIIETQTAYIPVSLFGSNSEIVNPEDVYIDENNNVYVADSGTKKVTKFDENGKKLLEVGEGQLAQPTGVYVDHNQEIYVADYKNEKVFRYSQEGEMIQEYARPDSPLFGTKSPYKPQKVTVDKRGNLYIIGEGSNNGIIQIGQDGTFLGFFGVNRTQSSLMSVVQEALTTEGQKSRMFLKVPPAPTNIAIDEKGLVFTVTAGTKFEVIRKLNIAGSNILPSDISDTTNLRDITVGPLGNFFVLENNGRIYEYDSYGNLLFIFGGKDDGTNRLGLFKDPTGISVDNLGRLLVTDRERGTIQMLEPTAFAEMMHGGISLYAEGLYVESGKYWSEVLRLNSSIGLAHFAMGEAYYKQQQYEEALESFKIVNSKEGYSNSFWEIRNIWMQEHLSKVFAVIIGLFAIRASVLYVDKKKGILKEPRKRWKRIKAKTLVSELLFLVNFLKKPVDSFYYVKRVRKVSLVSATILYLILFLEYLIMKYFTGFIFRGSNADQINFAFELVTLFLPILLFIVSNYLVSTISDGEGRFRDIYIGTIYSLAPYLMFIIPVTILSNALTLNEAFLYTFSMQVMIGWSLVILFIMVKEIHAYEFFETVRNILITIFCMIIIVLVCFIIYVLMDQVVDFVTAIIQEVILRV
ncbi:SMP-30/gluconolactonase/LRE family protein [Bacillus tianshenii]|uniref:SMP-30/gluconolactonase/LRE family protein n=1 Tax=Sutcliffiella tianshenii TaxID=1463404 RepID=UPI001CD78DD4|nr:YIP1 family protein [Bacillus tianshenii]MCA1319668.1 SMP-30/gluconolactonase/LRE family protein [Bacillus tianshenii]